MKLFGHEKAIRRYLLVGDYGSGKTEIAVNLALHLAAELPEQRLAIADLDLVNPYFRCREAIEPLEKAGLRVVVPAGGQRFADLPILMPEVKGLFQDDSFLSVLDVGGDEAGSRVLAGLAPVAKDYGFWFVVNANRPFHDSVEGCIRTIRRIEASSKMRVTGLVSNTHLMEETTAEMVLGGVELTENVAKRLGLSVAMVALMESVAPQLAPSAVPYPLLLMRRLMLPPWLKLTSKPLLGPDLFRIRPI